jgi:hypothetical protein
VAEEEAGRKVEVAEAHFLAVVVESKRLEAVVGDCRQIVARGH